MSVFKRLLYQNGFPLHPNSDFHLLDLKKTRPNKHVHYLQVIHLCFTYVLLQHFIYLFIFNFESSLWATELEGACLFYAGEIQSEVPHLITKDFTSWFSWHFLFLHIKFSHCLSRFLSLSLFFKFCTFDIA